MKMTRKWILVGATSAVALICSASDVAVPQAADLNSTLRGRLDELSSLVANSLSQWQPASGYVPADYPRDGSWERMIASAGH